MRSKKQLLVMLLSFIMVVTFMPSMAFATGDDGVITVNSMEELRAEITKAGRYNVSIKLGADISGVFSVRGKAQRDESGKLIRDDKGHKIVNKNTVVLDLNGHNITGTDFNSDGRLIHRSTIFVGPLGDLTIKGDGTVTPVKGKTDLDNKGNVTINGGTYKSCESRVFRNYGTMTINDGHIESITGEHAILNKSDNSIVSLTINGGKFTAECLTYHKNYTDNAKTIEINGGDFTEVEHLCYPYDPDRSMEGQYSIVVNGGTFSNGAQKDIDKINEARADRVTDENRNELVEKAMKEIKASYNEEDYDETGLRRIRSLVSTYEKVLSRNTTKSTIESNVENAKETISDFATKDQKASAKKAIEELYNAKTGLTEQDATNLAYELNNYKTYIDQETYYSSIEDYVEGYESQLLDYATKSDKEEATQKIRDAYSKLNPTEYSSSVRDKIKRLSKLDPDNPYYPFNYLISKEDLATQTEIYLKSVDSIIKDGEEEELRNTKSDAHNAVRNYMNDLVWENYSYEGWDQMNQITDNFDVSEVSSIKTVKELKENALKQLDEIKANSDITSYHEEYFSKMKDALDKITDDKYSADSIKQATEAYESADIQYLRDPAEMQESYDNYIRILESLPTKEAETAAAENEGVNNVIEQIQNLPDEVTVEQTSRVGKADYYLNQLSDKEKAKIPADVMDKLEKAKESIEQQKTDLDELATKKAEALESVGKDIDQSKYRSAEKAEIEKLIKKASDEIKDAKTLSAIEKAQKSLSDAVAKVKTDAELTAEEEAALADKKAEAKKAIEEQYDLSKYRDEEKAEVEKMIKDAEAAIDKAASASEIEKAQKDLTEAAAKVKTDEQLKAEEKAALDTAKEEAKKAVEEQYDTSKYSGEEKAAMEKALEDAKAAIDKAESPADVEAAKKALSDTAATVKTDEQKKAEADAKASLDAAKEAAKKAVDEQYDLSKYRDDQKAEIQKMIDDAKAAIDKATDAAGVEAAKTGFVAAAEKVQTDEQMTAAENTAAKKLGKGKITRLIKGKKKMTVKWKKVKRAKGYQFRYSLKKNFKKGKKYTKYKKVKKFSKKGLKIKKLKSKKTYYVQVRAFTKVNGKTVYGKWSKTKKIKIK